VRVVVVGHADQPEPESRLQRPARVSEARLVVAPAVRVPYLDVGRDFVVDLMPRDLVDCGGMVHVRGGLACNDDRPVGLVKDRGFSAVLRARGAQAIGYVVVAEVGVHVPAVRPLDAGKGDEHALLVEGGGSRSVDLRLFRREENVVAGEDHEVEPDDVARDHEEVVGGPGRVVGQARVRVDVAEVDGSVEGGGEQEERYQTDHHRCTYATTYAWHLHHGGCHLGAPSGTRVTRAGFALAGAGAPGRSTGDSRNGSEPGVQDASVSGATAHPLRALRRVDVTMPPPPSRPPPGAQSGSGPRAGVSTGGGIRNLVGGGRDQLAIVAV